MKIGINQSVFKRFGGFEEQIKELCAFGFDALDFGDMSDSSGSELLFMPHSQFEKALRECRDIADSNGIEICQIHSRLLFRLSTQRLRSAAP